MLKRRVISNKSAIILDLDNCLIYCPQTKLEYGYDLKKKYGDRIRIFDIRSPEYPYGSGINESMFLITRKGLDEFIKFIVSKFDYVFVWTAGIHAYGNAITDVIFPKGVRRPDAIFTRSHQDKIDVTHKPLSMIWDKYIDIDPERTVHVDDNYSNFDDNTGHGITITFFEPIIDMKKVEIIGLDDEALPTLVKYFQSNKFSMPVTSQDLNIFKLDIEKLRNG